LSVRFRQIGLVLAALAAVSTAAFGQSQSANKAAASSTSIADTLPRHPIPYKAFKKIGVKPKPKAKPAASATGGATPATGVASAKPATPPPPGATAKPAPAKVPPSVIPRPTVAQSAAGSLVTTPPPAKLVAAKPTAAASKPQPATPAPIAAPPPPLPAPQVGARLQPGQALPASELEAFIDGQVSRAMESDHVAGVAVAVVQNGQLVMEKGYGGGAAGPTSRIDPRTSLVRLGSGSQIFTWIAALKAVEDGKLKLDAPVNSYLPDDLQIPDEGFDRPILFRHLMSHTAGFEDRALGRRYVLDPEKLTPLDDALRRLRPRRVRAAGLLSIPSDYGVALAGDIVAKAEGRPFDQLVESEILKPLALMHTSFREPYPPANALPDPLSQALSRHAAPGFRWTGQGFQPQPFAYGQSLAPALSASTTADDMARLMIALLDNGRMGEAILYGPKSAALLRTPLQHPAPGVDGWAHGLAMQRLAGGFEALSDVGAAPTFRSNLSLVPGLNLGVFIVADTDTGGALADVLPGAIVQRFYVSKPAAQAQGAATGADYAGAYLSARRAYHGLEAFADRLTLQSSLEANSEGGLALHRADGTRVFSPADAPDQFQSEDGAQLYAPTVDGRAKAYVLGSGEGAAERIDGVHAPSVLIFWAAAALLTVLASFAGLFIRDRLDPRETRAQITASVTQVVTCVVWCVAFGAFYLFVKGGLSTADLMFAWPSRWLILASWAALIAGLLSLLMVTQLPGVWREERRIHGWSVWRKLRHTGTVAVFLVFTGVLAAWGALEPWSS
jgi:CubicO group peptidase (beta-lactamase class C family)